MQVPCRAFETESLEPGYNPYLAKMTVRRLTDSCEAGLKNRGPDNQ